MAKPIKTPEILLPKTEDMTSWAVIACDQFTSEPLYWEKLEQITEGKLSALNLIFPEVYLSEDNSSRIQKINENMHRYLDSGVFSCLGAGFILTVRKTPYNERRLGLVLSVDLESYSFVKEDRAPIRATEGTILDRLPPRMEIRKNAPLELPHIMLLYDDEERGITEKLYERRSEFKKVYDFDLNMGGGHIEGYFIDNTEEIKSKFYQLAKKNSESGKYGGREEFLFAVGDGNHSLATAKRCWEEIKKDLSEDKRESHPARYALAEAINIYDEGLKFEPIHRLVKNIELCKILPLFDLKEGTKSYIFSDGNKYPVYLPKDVAQAIAYTDKIISGLAGNEVKADYIHGEKSLSELSVGKAVGIMMPHLNKEDFFKTVSINGSLPRKTFSMGEAVEKRYYIEAKKIR